MSDNMGATAFFNERVFEKVYSINGGILNGKVN